MKFLNGFPSSSSSSCASILSGFINKHDAHSDEGGEDDDEEHTNKQESKIINPFKAALLSSLGIEGIQLLAGIPLLDNNSGSSLSIRGQRLRKERKDNKFDLKCFFSFINKQQQPFASPPTSHKPTTTSTRRRTSPTEGEGENR